MRTRRWLALLVATTALASGGVSAHDFPVDTVMSAFVKVEAHDVHLLLRVPLDLLDAAKFPTNGVNEIDIAAAGPVLERVQKVFGASMLVWEGGRRILPSSRATQLALPSDRSFASYAGALSRFRAASAPETAIYYGQGYVDLHFTYAIASPKPALSLQTTFGAELGDRLKLDLQYLPANEPGRPYLITSRSGRVALDPTWSETLAGFGWLGVTRILSGLEYLLFLVCLIVPVRRVRPMVPVVAAFTVGHSMALVAAACGLTPAGPWFLPLVDTLMAASIVSLAVENVVDVSNTRRWLLACLCGLVYGVGFSSVLRENFQFAGSHRLASVLFFNVGIEAGQLAVIALIVVWRFFLLRGAPLSSTGVAVLSVVVGHTAWHWMIDQGELLWRTEWPAFDAVSLAIAARVAAGILIAIGASRLVRPWFHRSGWVSGLGTGSLPDVVHPSTERDVNGAGAIVDTQFVEDAAHVRLDRFVCSPMTRPPLCF
jgi:HupE/UreJ protein